MSTMDRNMEIMKKFLCWIFCHRWRQIHRRHTMDLDHVEYKCSCCHDEAGGADGLLVLPKRPTLKSVIE